MEKIKLEVAGIPAVLYGKRSRRVYLYVHGKNGSAAEAAPRTMRPRCSLAVLASTESIVDLPQPFPPTIACTAPVENATSSPHSTQPVARS